MAAAPQHYLDSNFFTELIRRFKSVRPIDRLEITMNKSIIKIKARAKATTSQPKPFGLTVVYKNIEDLSTYVMYKLFGHGDDEEEVDENKFHRRRTANYMAEVGKFLEKFFDPIYSTEPVANCSLDIEPDSHRRDGELRYYPLKEFLQTRAADEKFLNVGNFTVRYHGGDEDAKEILYFLPIFTVTGELVIEQHPNTNPKALSMDEFSEIRSAQIAKNLTVERLFTVAPNMELAKFEHFDIYMKPEDMTANFAIELISKLNNSRVFDSGVIKISFEPAQITNSEFREHITDKFKGLHTQDDIRVGITKWKCKNQSSLVTDMIVIIERDWKFTFENESRKKMKKTNDNVL